MLSGLLARLVKLLLGRHGSALHWRASAAATVVLAVVLLAGSYGAVLAERGAPGAQLTTYPRALWWSVEIATTVGYGDLHLDFSGSRLLREEESRAHRTQDRHCGKDRRNDARRTAEHAIQIDRQNMRHAAF